MSSADIVLDGQRGRRLHHNLWLHGKARTAEHLLFKVISRGHFRYTNLHWLLLCSHLHPQACAFHTCVAVCRQQQENTGVTGTHFQDVCASIHAVENYLNVSLLMKPSQSSCVYSTIISSNFDLPWKTSNDPNWLVIWSTERWTLFSWRDRDPCQAQGSGTSLDSISLLMGLPFFGSVLFMSLQTPGHTYQRPHRCNWASSQHQALPI